MSTLLNLLAKVKNSTRTSGVNPGLKHAMANSQSKTNSREKYTRVILLGLVAILIGGGVLYYLEFMRPTPKQAFNRRPSPEPIQAQPSSAKTPLAEAVQAALSSSRGQAIQPPRSSVSKPAAAAKTSKTATAVHHTSLPAPLAHRAQPADKQGNRSKATLAHQEQRPQQPVSVKKPAPDSGARDALLLAARDSEQKKDLSQAIRLYRQAADAEPDNYRIQNNIAGISIQQGNYGEALTSAQQALTLRPDYLPALINMGIAAARLGKEQEAARWFGKALAIEANHRGALYNLALLRERAGQYDAADDLYRRLVNAGEPQGYMGLGRIEEKQLKFAEARQTYRALLALPETPASMKNIARERMQQME